MTTWIPLLYKPNMNMRDFKELYDLEKYLLETVRLRFQIDHHLSAFDFFCIIIWKANRAKSKIADRLMKNGDNLDDVVRLLTNQVYNANSDKEKLRVLVESWGFRLPMASAILTMLFPDNFTVYDVRVCNELQKHHKLGTLTNFDSIWSGYQEFISNVRNEEPNNLSLRDKDRYLWGKSFAVQLEKDIAKNFLKTE